MILEDLRKGTKLTLNLVWGNLKYDLKTEVAEVAEHSILIPVFSYHGMTLDFDRPEFRGILFHLYAYDNLAQERFCWKNVVLKQVQYQRKKYYEIMVSAYRKYGQVSDCREDYRIPVDVSASILVGSEDGTRSYSVNVKDISNGGIAFVSSSEFETAGCSIEVEFEDSVRHHRFRLQINCRCVRTVKQEDGTILYGCKFIKANNDVLAYVYLKRVETEKGNVVKV